MHGETDFEAASQDLDSLGYMVVSTGGGEEKLMAAVHAVGRLIGARGFGYTHLRATGSDLWLGRHTESLTDGATPLRYFALGCLVPAAHGGATHLYDGSEAAHILKVRVSSMIGRLQ